MECNIYFLFPGLEPARAFRWQPPAGARTRLYLFIDWIVARVTKYRREEEVWKWSYAGPHHGGSSNGKIKLNASDAESKNHKA